MGKRSQKRLVHHERSQAGCMSGFIGIFDFRQGRSTRRLLSDRRHGSSRHAAAGTAPAKGRLTLSSSDEKDERRDADIEKFSDGGETERLIVGISKTSVKKLIEEDMSSEQQIDKQIPNEVKQVRSETDCKENEGKRSKPKKKPCRAANDIRVQDSRALATLESQKLSRLDITSLMEEFCNQIQHRHELQLHHGSGGDSCHVEECTDIVIHNHVDELDMNLVKKHSVLQEKLSEAAEAFLSQKLVDAKQLREDGTIHQSKQFIDALEILNSNKELLMKLLQDSNSLLVKHIQDLVLQDAPSEKVKQEKPLAAAKLSEGIGNSRQDEELVCQKEAQKHNIHNFFRKKEKRKSTKESDTPQVSNRIVVLKPKATGIQNSVTTSSPSSSPQSHYTLKNHGWSGRFNSQFSLNEIKRKLRSTIGENRKDRHWISMDDNLHKIPNKQQESSNCNKVDRQTTAGRELSSKPHLHRERTTQPSNNVERQEKIEKTTPSYPSTATEVPSTSGQTAEYPTLRKSNLYIEAKKHLEEILTRGDEAGESSSEQNPKTLGKILSLPEYALTPLCSPGRDGENGFVTAQMRFSPNGKFRFVNENIWRFKPDNGANRASPLQKNSKIEQDVTDGNDKLEFDVSPLQKNSEMQQDVDDGNDLDNLCQEFDASPDSFEKILPGIEIHESICSSREDTSPKGGAEIMKEIDVASLEEGKLSEEPSQVNNITPITSANTDTTPGEEEEEEELSECSRLDLSPDDRAAAPSICCVSPCSILLEKVDSQANINDPPEGPSPISVLEPFFEDFNSPTTTTPQDDLHIQRLHFDIEEDNCSTVVVTTSDLHNHPRPRPCIDDKIPPFEYITTVVQASNLNWTELMEKHRSSDLLLNPSLFEEVELTTNHYSGDKRLLFDCVNEVLGELYERYFGSSHLVSFVNPDIRPAPVGEGIIHEVWGGISWNLLPQLMPRTLDQIIEKDMEKSRTWMDLRFDSESIGNEMVEIILEELMEDTIVDLRS